VSGSVVMDIDCTVCTCLFLWKVGTTDPVGDFKSLIERGKFTEGEGELLIVLWCSHGDAYVHTQGFRE